MLQSRRHRFDAKNHSPFPQHNRNCAYYTHNRIGSAMKRVSWSFRFFNQCWSRLLDFKPRTDARAPRPWKEPRILLWRQTTCGLYICPDTTATSALQYYGIACTVRLYDKFCCMRYSIYTLFVFKLYLYVNTSRFVWFDWKFGARTTCGKNAIIL